MTRSNTFRRFADFIETIETSDMAVTNVTAPNGGIFSEETLQADLSISGEFLQERGVNDVDLSVTDARIRQDGEFSVDLEIELQAIEGEGSHKDQGNTNKIGNDIHTTRMDKNGGTPPYQDPELLREVYNEYDTFPEMKDALGVDVTAETVRLHMVDHGIHDPDADRSNGSLSHNGDAQHSDSEGEAAKPDGSIEELDPSSVPDGAIETGHHDANNDDLERVPDASEEESDQDNLKAKIADEIDLPENVSLDDIKSAVQSVHTIHQVQRQLDLDREQTRRLLIELDLLELVSGRLESAPNDDIPIEEIDARIREAVLDSDRTVSA